MKRKRFLRLRGIAVLLSLCMLLGVVSVWGMTAFAADAPTTISTVAELEAFRDAVNGGETYAGKTVLLTASLDLGEITSWELIGGMSTTFQGTFDGGNHIIYNLNIQTNSRYCGLFGKLQNAVVKNLGLENVTVVSSNDDVAGLAGNARGSTIEGCYVTGSVKGDGATSGILGSTHSSAEPTLIKNCYARVALTASGYTSDVAGISGWNAATSVKIENCFSACVGEVRPIAGWSDGSAVENSQFVNTFFDKTLSLNFSTGSGRADLGKTTSELKEQSLYAGWDFDSVWIMESDKNGGYPYLRGFTPGLSGAPGSVSVKVTDDNGSPVTDADVSIQNSDTTIPLSHQGDGVYSGTVTTSDATYDIVVNGEKKGEFQQSDNLAAGPVTVPNEEPIQPGSIEEVQANLDRAVETLNAALKDHTNDIVALDTAMKDLADAYKAADLLLKSDFEQADAALAESLQTLENTLTQAEKALQDSIGQVQSNLDKAVETLNGAIGTNSSDITALKASIAALEKAYKDADSILSSGIAELKTKNTDWEKKISALELSYAAVDQAWKDTGTASQQSVGYEPESDPEGQQSGRVDQRAADSVEQDEKYRYYHSRCLPLRGRLSFDTGCLYGN